MATFICWILLSLLVGAIGSGRQVGFAGAFLWSLFLSPLIGIIIAVSSKSNHDVARENELLRLQQQQAEALSRLTTAPVPPPVPVPTVGEITLPLDPDARANRLKDLRDRGVITQQEFMEQLSRL